VMEDYLDDFRGGAAMIRSVLAMDPLLSTATVAELLEFEGDRRGRWNRVNPGGPIAVYAAGPRATGGRCEGWRRAER